MPDAPELLDLPLKVSDGVLLIDASFHNSSYPFGRIFSVREMILVSESAITGKIQVWNNEDGYDIHYQFDRSGKDSKERLVIHDKDCTLYNHSEMIQNAHLFGDNKPLRDLIMMTGPSIIYRFAGQSAVWSEATQHGLSRKLNTTVVSYSTFVITLDFHNTYDFSPGAKQFQIEFKGYDQVSESHGQRLLMDIYLHRSFTPIQISDLKYKTQVNHACKKATFLGLGFNYGPSSYPPGENLEFHKIGSDSILFDFVKHKPSPGIGCPNYLIPSERKPIPKLLAKYVNFTMYEEIEGSTNNRPFSEITASVQSLLMRLKTNLNGVKTEVIYDHRHGIALTLEEGGRCQIAISNNNSPGLDVMFRFRLENLFFVDGDFNYLRKDYFVDRFEFLVDAWESVQFNVDFQGNKVDKIVFTHFFVESPIIEKKFYIDPKEAKILLKENYKVTNSNAQAKLQSEFRQQNRDLISDYNRYTACFKLDGASVNAVKETLRINQKLLTTTAVAGSKNRALEISADKMIEQIQSEMPNIHMPRFIIGTSKLSWPLLLQSDLQAFDVTSEYLYKTGELRPESYRNQTISGSCHFLFVRIIKQFYNKYRKASLEAELNILNWPTLEVPRASNTNDLIVDRALMKIVIELANKEDPTYKTPGGVCQQLFTDIVSKITSDFELIPMAQETQVTSRIP
uniref:Uncharacterized protein n=1 Tax=Tetranychus urticae TaxID=32264 RepID=T1L0H8_TETUR